MHTLGYDYDSLNRIKTRTLSGTGIAAPEATSYRWDGADRLLEHVTTIGGTSHKTEYEYDAAARLAARHVQAGQGGKLTQRYGYDLAERLSQIKYIRNEGTAGEQLIEQIDYSYDAKGQRIAKTTLNGHGTGKQDTPMQAPYDAANRLQTITLQLDGQSKSYTLSHDANGNLSTKQNSADSADKTTYSWDSNNRLVGIQQPGLSASFTYDAYGRRIQSSITKNGATSTVQYLHEGLQALGEIRDQSLSHRLLTGLSLDETIARLAIGGGSKDAANSRLYLTDALNSVIAQMNDNGSVSLANSYGYSPYGQSSTLGVDAAGNPIQYTSRENDGTGLLFYRARYYEQNFGGQFLSEDPIGLAGGLNLFSYAFRAPTRYADPTGNSPLVLIGGVAAACYSGWKAYSYYQDASEAHDRLKRAEITSATNQEMQRAMHRWYGSGMKGPSPYSQAQLQDAAKGVVSSASELAETGTKLPGTSFGGPIVTPPGPLVSQSKGEKTYGK